MGTPTCLSRLRKELADLERDPPPLVTCYPSEDDITQLEAYLNGPPSTPYEKGIFRLDVNMPENYPFDPPMIRFRTPIYHPNIDECGRICASVLKKGKDDQWKPSMNLRTTLLSLHALIGEPNPDDPLDADIAREYQQDYDLFVKKAREHTRKYAVEKPDNLIPDPYAVSTTHMAKTTDIDIDNHPDDSAPLLSTDAPGNMNIASSSKSKAKSKLSLSKKKQPDTRPPALPSSSTECLSKNNLKPKDPLTLHKEEVALSRQQMDYEDEGSNHNKDSADQRQKGHDKHDNDSNNEIGDTGGVSILNSPECRSRNKATKHQRGLTHGRDGSMKQPSLSDIKDGSGNKDDKREMEINGDKRDDTEQSSLVSGQQENSVDKDDKHEKEINDDKCDDMEQSSLASGHEEGSLDKDAKHEKEIIDDKCDDMEQSSFACSHAEGSLDKVAKHENESINQLDNSEYKTGKNGQEKQAHNDKGEIVKQVEYTDITDEMETLEHPMRDKAISLASGACDRVDQATVGESSNKSGSVEQESHKDEMEETGENTANQHQLTLSLSSSSSSIGKTTSAATSGVIPNEAPIVPTAKVIPTASLPLTPSTDKSPSPTPAIISNSNDDVSMDIIPPQSPLKTVTTDDMPGWTYTNHYSSHYLTLTTNDPLGDIFPVYEDEERPTTQKRKSKLSLSCKKKSKTT